jgi:hypothetical protein
MRPDLPKDPGNVETPNFSDMPSRTTPDPPKNSHGRSRVDRTAGRRRRQGGPGSAARTRMRGSVARPDDGRTQAGLRYAGTIAGTPRVTPELRRRYVAAGRQPAHRESRQRLWWDYIAWDDERCATSRDRVRVRVRWGSETGDSGAPKASAGGGSRGHRHRSGTRAGARQSVGAVFDLRRMSGGLIDTRGVGVTGADIGPPSSRSDHAVTAGHLSGVVCRLT